MNSRKPPMRRPGGAAGPLHHNNGGKKRGGPIGARGVRIPGNLPPHKKPTVTSDLAEKSVGDAAAQNQQAEKNPKDANLARTSADTAKGTPLETPDRGQEKAKHLPRGTWQSEREREKGSEKVAILTDSGQGVVRIVQPATHGFGFGMRVLTLGLVAMVALVMLFPTISRYVTQKEQYRHSIAQAAALRAENDDLEQQLELWNDRNYVEAKARERFGYVLPGETLYVVQDPESVKGGVDKSEQARLKTQKSLRDATPWYQNFWDSVVLSGQSSVAKQTAKKPAITGKEKPVSSSEKK